MSVAGKFGFLALALVAVVGAGYASVRGMLPALPLGLDQTIKSASLAAAEKLGVKAPAKTPGAAPGTPPGSAAASTGPATPQQRPPVTVRVGKAEIKTMPVRFEVIGTVQPLASVSVRARVDSQIMSVEFTDGANVKAGDVLFRLDPRQVDALIKQAEGNLLRSKATLELNDLDVKRKETLANREATSQALVDAARAGVAQWRAQIKADEAFLENLRIQRTFHEILAPISGRIGVANFKVGNIVRAGEAAQVLATINQISPIYVAFPVPQRLLPELRESMRTNADQVSAQPQGMARSADGRIALLENSVDATTGTITGRAIFENAEELLWPGSLANVRVTLRMVPNSVAIPREAVMNGQNGPYVYVVDGAVVRMRSVTVDRTIDALTVISSGLKGDETVVTDGQMLLNDGARVVVPGGVPATQGPPAAGAPAKPPGTQG